MLLPILHATAVCLPGCCLSLRVLATCNGVYCAQAKMLPPHMLQQVPSCVDAVHRCKSDQEQSSASSSSMQAATQLASSLLLQMGGVQAIQQMMKQMEGIK
jgi:hypothetical protein